MTYPELVVLAIAVAMDSVAVSLALGMQLREHKFRAAMLIAGIFGIFHVVMPVLGWALSFSFADLVNSAAPWIAFGLLVVVGGHMVKESFEDEHHVEGVKVGLVALLPLALATSIDIAAVGVSFGFLEVDIVPAVLLIGSIVFVLALLAVLLGAKLGERMGKWATLAGGVVLILIGLRILAEHLWF